MIDPSPPQASPKTDAIILERLIAGNSAMEQCFETLITYAASRKATDFFCAANREGHALFMRCEGTLYQLGNVPKAWGEHFINHVKVLAHIPITDHRHPLDGRLLIHDGDTPVDLRIGTMPTFFGEELAIRILDSRFRLVDLAQLGMLQSQREKAKRLTHERSGLVLVSGRTGSGKTTTLYSILNALNDGSRKINTLEDPVECDIPGVYQSQVNPKLGQDFPDLLRALLRHAPDVIMVGEIRDTETAEVAVQAAIAGQAVFATLHAPNAAQAIFTLLQLGINPHVLAGALNGVIAQDMLRQPCESCAKPADIPAAPFSLDEVRTVMGNDFTPRVVAAEGCDECDQRGFHGLTGIFELLEASTAIRDLIRNDASPAAITRQAIEEGMVPRSTAAQIAVAKGLASFDEAVQIIHDGDV